ncbi:MAG TPA: spermidine/putrescine ABC transporter substrate-binding protein [Desulfopila sp.]|nr:spermidine/putrescine ABC transporter substrate-binding protein [Desulfopila sp.]
MQKNSIALMVMGICLIFFILGCEQEPTQPSPSPGLDSAKDIPRPAGKSETGAALRFYNWEDYTGEHTIEKFTEFTGIGVHLETFDDDEVVLGALQSGAIKVDLIVVSESMAREMHKAKLIQAVDYAVIANSKHIKPEYIPEADNSGNRFWVPYLWGYTGMAVNTKYIKDTYHSWSLLWDPKYENKLAMLNNTFETSAAAAKKLGYQVNPTLEQLEEVEAELLAQKELLVGYLSVGEIMDGLRDESIWAAQIYNGDGMVLADENEDIEFVNVREGMALWIDVFVIPRDAPHPELAHAFIDFLHTPKILADIAAEFWYASTNETAEQYMPAEVLQAEEVYPSEKILEKSEFFGDMGSPESVRKRLQIWSMLMRKQ